MPEGPAFFIYQDRADEWRWTLVAGNNRIVADSAEGYTSREGAENGMNLVRRFVNSQQLHIHNGAPPR